jgi:hypothetical protein
MAADRWSKNLDRNEKMNADALAPQLIRQCAGPRGYDEPVKVLWERAFNALHRVNDRWTRRRVRAVWQGEARRIEWDEMLEMARVAELQNARKQHAEYLAETARLAALRVAVEASQMG